MKSSEYQYPELDNSVRKESMEGNGGFFGG
jgi:hypothetical protein